MSQHAHSDNDAVAITIRLLGSRDAADLRRVAQRDSAREPRGELLGAEADGHLVAAVSTTTGEVIADPFQPTADVVKALRERARHTNGRHGPVRRLLSRLRRPTDSRAALPT